MSANGSGDDLDEREMERVWARLNSLTVDSSSNEARFFSIEQRIARMAERLFALDDRHKEHFEISRAMASKLGVSIE